MQPIKKLFTVVGAADSYIPGSFVRGKKKKTFPLKCQWSGGCVQKRAFVRGKNLSNVSGLVHAENTFVVLGDYLRLCGCMRVVYMCMCVHMDV